MIVDLCRKIQNAVWWQKKKNNSRTSSRCWESILFSSVLNCDALRSQEAAQSLDLFLLLLILLVPSRSSPIAHHTSSPSSGLLLFQFQAGRPLPRPSGKCSAAHSAFTWTSSRGSGRQKNLCSILHVWSSSLRNLSGVHFSFSILR